MIVTLKTADTVLWIETRMVVDDVDALRTGIGTGAAINPLGDKAAVLPDGRAKENAQPPE